MKLGFPEVSDMKAPGIFRSPWGGLFRLILNSCLTTGFYKQLELFKLLFENSEKAPKCGATVFNDFP